MKFIVKIFILNLIIFQLSYAQTKIKNIFDPNNVKKDNKNQNKITKNFDFILYGIINTKNLKMVLIKPKVITREVRKKMGKSKYISLKIGEEFQNIKLISIDNDTAKFKKGDKIIAMRVFQNIKNDRIKIANVPSPTIINSNPALQLPKNKINIKNKRNNFTVIRPSNSKSSKRSTTIKNNNKPVKRVNPFLELLKRAKMHNNNSNTRPVKNPFLELLKNRR